MKAAGFAVAIALAGCATTPAMQIGLLGNTARDVAGKTDAVLDEYNHAALERSFTDYAAIYSGDHARLLTSDQLAGITPPVSAEQKKNFAICNANRALAAYCSALASLATSKTRADIDQATVKLHGSMSAINKQYKVLTGSGDVLFDREKVARTSSFITAIGTVIIEEKRRNAIKEIVLQADPNITLVCDAIIRQLDAAKIEDSIAASRQYILSEEIVAYRESAAKPTTLDWRREQIRRLYGLQQGVSNSRLLVSQARNAIKALRDAHAVLAREVSKNRFSSGEIDAAIGTLAEIKDQYDDLETLLLHGR
jgi:hypothetical protein